MDANVISALSGILGTQAQSDAPREITKKNDILAAFTEKYKPEDVYAQAYGYFSEMIVDNNKLVRHVQKVMKNLYVFFNNLN